MYVSLVERHKQIGNAAVQTLGRACALDKHVVRSTYFSNTNIVGLNKNMVGGVPHQGNDK